MDLPEKENLGTNFFFLLKEESRGIKSFYMIHIIT